MNNSHLKDTLHCWKSNYYVSSMIKADEGRTQIHDCTSLEVMPSIVSYNQYSSSFRWFSFGFSIFLIFFPLTIKSKVHEISQKD